MDNTTITVIVTALIGVLGSFPAAHISERRERIYGGLPAKLFHQIGIGFYLGIIPAALLGTFLVGPLRLGIPLAFTCLGIGLSMLFLYSIFERPARVGLVAEDHGWTEADARSSGL